jgi:hypothetical protein
VHQVGHVPHRQRAGGPDRLLDGEHRAGQRVKVLLLGDRHRVVLGAQEVGGVAGSLDLVGLGAAAGEAHGVGPHQRRVASHHRAHGRRVDPAGQHHPDGDVAHHLPGHRALEGVPVLAHQRAPIAPLPPGRLEAVLELLDPVRPRRQHGGRPQLAHRAQGGGRGGHEAEGEEVVDRHQVHLARDRRVGEQGLDLGGEGQPAAGPGPVQGLDPEPVASQVQGPGPHVPQRDREDAVQALHEPRPLLLVKVGDDLAVGARAQPVPPRLQARPQLGVVVELAVEHDDDVAALVGQRLVAVLGIDDGQPAHAQRHLGGVEQALSVRSAVDQAGDHRGHHLWVGVAAGRVDAGDAAHGRQPSPPRGGLELDSPL